MADDPENPRAVPADQRTEGPNQTMFMSADDLAEQLQAESAKAPNKPMPIAGTPSLVGVSPVVAGQTHQLTREKTSVGRTADNDIVIDDGTLSERHAQIVCEDNVWRVINLVSTNGTAVNGRRDVVSYLAPGDTIHFGNVEMQFELQGAGDATERISMGSVSGSGGQASSGGGSSRNAIIIGATVLVIAAIAAIVLLA